MNHSNRYFGAYIIYYAISMIAKAPFLVARNFFKLSGDTMGIAIALYAASAVLSFIVLVLFHFTCIWCSLAMIYQYLHV